MLQLIVENAFEGNAKEIPQGKGYTLPVPVYTVKMQMDGLGSQRFYVDTNPDSAIAVAQNIRLDDLKHDKELLARETARLTLLCDYFSIMREDLLSETNTRLQAILYDKHSKVMDLFGQSFGLADNMDLVKSSVRRCSSKAMLK